MIKEQRRTLYVTKWVIARGIVVLEAERDTRPWRKGREWYHLDFPGKDHLLEMVGIGKDAFYTLEEAQEDALRRWEKYAQHTAEVAEKAQKGLQKALRDELQVHYSPKLRISNYHAFADDE